MPHSPLTNDEWEEHSARVEANLIKDRTKLASAKFQKRLQQHTCFNYDREKNQVFLDFESLTFILEPLHRNTCFGKGIAAGLKFFYLLELVVFGPLLDDVMLSVRKTTIWRCVENKCPTGNVTLRSSWNVEHKWPWMDSVITMWRGATKLIHVGYI